MERLSLDSIRLDGGTQPRAKLDDRTVAEYAELIKGGSEFPPVVVFFDGEKYWLADGFHRVHGARRAGRAEIGAEVRQGDRRQAVLYSVGANARHGLPRTNEDKRRAVVTLLSDSEWSTWTLHDIAHACGVSQRLVVKIKTDNPHLAHNAGDVRVVTRCGRTYRMHVNRRSRRGKRLSPHALTLVRDSQPLPAKTVLELPHDPLWAARALVSAFDHQFLQGLVRALNQHLQGDSQ